jgi:hypothetical protein
MHPAPLVDLAALLIAGLSVAFIGWAVLRVSRRVSSRASSAALRSATLSDQIRSSAGTDKAPARQMKSPGLGRRRPGLLKDGRRCRAPGELRPTTNQQFSREGGCDRRHVFSVPRGAGVPKSDAFGAATALKAAIKQFSVRRKDNAIVIRPG